MAYFRAKALNYEKPRAANHLSLFNYALEELVLTRLTDGIWILKS